MKHTSIANTKYDNQTKPRWQTIISLLSCFSGGVFIGACFLDLIPGVEQLFQQVLRLKRILEITIFLASLNSKVLEDAKTEYGITTDLPVVPFIVVVGFILVLIIEQTVLSFQVRNVFATKFSVPQKTFIGRET